VWTSSGGKMHTRDAQGMLKGLGPAAGSSRMTNLAVDGAWGPLSSAAMKDFQSLKGIPTTGSVGPDDADTLFATWQAAGSP
jgi:peptidoglycan hydrolase-like protein with peptidoglycan-binding domain